MKNVAVIGAGVMGSGIALACIQSGYPTLLFDVHTTALKNGLQYIKEQLQLSVDKGKSSQKMTEKALSLLKITENREDLKAELIIEAIQENIESKQELFLYLESINSLQSIFATNTSSIPITQIAAPLKHAERIVGIHFFNPAHIMKLVEIIPGSSTDPEITQKSIHWAKSLGKTAVLVADSPGFIVNRVARHYYVESLKILEENVAGIESIDLLMEQTGFKMGPFKLMDLIGVDTNFAVTSSLFQQFHFDSKFQPNRIQQQKVNAGHHGRKTKHGFYHYP